MDYFRNMWLWLRGFGWMWTRQAVGLNAESARHYIQYKPGWTPGKFLALYLVDYGACVILLAGPVTSVSRYAQMHRSGWVWDKLLDVLDAIDQGHGEASGPVLWGSVEPPKWVRIAVPVAWVLVVLSLWWRFRG